MNINHCPYAEHKQHRDSVSTDLSVPFAIFRYSTRNLKWTITLLDGVNSVRSILLGNLWNPVGRHAQIEYIWRDRHRYLPAYVVSTAFTQTNVEIGMLLILFLSGRLQHQHPTLVHTAMTNKLQLKIRVEINGHADRNLLQMGKAR